MVCQYKQKLQAYLDEDLTKEEMQTLENHLDNCVKCQEELDKLLSDSVPIRGQAMDVEDEVLISKIKARIKGNRRIVLYGIFGFVLGIFSRFYTMDDFIVTKAIMALPYKLAEFALGIFFSGNVLQPWQQGYWRYSGSMGFFPHNPILDFAASVITPAIIATFIAVMVGYLFSDKRVFQRKKIINFIAAGLLTLLVWSGALHGVYSHTLNKIDNLESIKGVTIYQLEAGDISWLLRIDEQALSQTNYAELVQGLSAANETGRVTSKEIKDGFELLLEFAGGGRMIASVDSESGEMLMQNFKSYQLAEDTVERLTAIAEVKDNE